MSRTQREILVEARTHFEVLASHARGDLLNQLVVDAICMRLSAGIEVLNTLDPEVRKGLFGDDWTVMWGMRNRIAHGYLLVNPDIIRQTVEQDVPDILGRIDGELNQP